MRVDGWLKVYSKYGAALTGRAASGSVELKSYPTSLPANMEYLCAERFC